MPHTRTTSNASPTAESRPGGELAEMSGKQSSCRFSRGGGGRWERTESKRRVRHRHRRPVTPLGPNSFTLGNSGYIQTEFGAVGESLQSCVTTSVQPKGLNNPRLSQMRRLTLLKLSGIIEGVWTRQDNRIFHHFHSYSHGLYCCYTVVCCYALVLIVHMCASPWGMWFISLSDPHQGAECVPAAGDAPWASESGSAPVLRRLRQNREKRDSRIRASALIFSQNN